MAGGGDEPIIARWRELVTTLVPDARMQGNLVGIALVFADLAGRVPEWKRGLEGFQMTESQVVNEWISQGKLAGELKASREILLHILQRKFPGLVPEDVSRFISQQDSLPLLADWLDAALTAASIEEFIAVLRH
jgi:hypothetical protein